MKIKLLFLTVLVIFVLTLGGCSSMCGSGPGNTNSNTPTPTPAVSPSPVPSATAPPATPSPVPTLPPDQVTGIPECDDLFAKFEAWAKEKNKDGSKAEKIALAGIRLALIIPIKRKIEKMKPSDRDTIAAQCSIAATQFEKKQRALEIDPNANVADVK